MTPIFHSATYDSQRANVLPSLLQKRNQVVDGQHDVRDQLILSHANVANGDTQAEDLLQLELDGRLDIGDLLLEILVVGDGGGELAGLGETRTQETRNLLDELLGSDESVILAGKLLDELLVLVELLQVIDAHGIISQVLGTVNVVLVTKDADGHAGARNLRELDGARETLVTHGIIVLEADLELYGLQKVALLDIERVVKKFLDVTADSGCSKSQYRFSYVLHPFALCRIPISLRRYRRPHTDSDFRHVVCLPNELVRRMRCSIW